VEIASSLWFMEADNSNSTRDSLFIGNDDPNPFPDMNI